MSTLDFYAHKVAEYGSDVHQFAGVFKADLLRGDIVGAREMLSKLEHQTWLLIDNAKSAIAQAEGRS